MSQGTQPPSGDEPEDPIDLSMLPPAHQARARMVICAVEGGITHTLFRGKRLKHDRSQISVPLGTHWRLLFEEVNHRPVPIACMSHSDYNGRKPGARRRGKRPK